MNRFVTEKPRFYAGLRGTVTRLQKLQVRMESFHLIKGYRFLWRGYKILNRFVTEKPRFYAGLRGTVTRLQKLQVFYKPI